jgi:hypothetical protein
MKKTCDLNFFQKFSTITGSLSGVGTQAGATPG